MKLNPKKFELMTMGTNSHLKESTKYRAPDDSEIVRKQSLKDLGVIMSEDASFDAHLESVVLKGKRMASWILRKFKRRDPPKIMKILLKQLVVSNMEYCSPLWSPTERGKIEKLEAVQKSFTRHITGLNGENRPCYSERLKILQIYSLERRRERYLILYVFKVLNNLVPNPGFHWEYNERTGYRIATKREKPSTSACRS